MSFLIFKIIFSSRIHYMNLKSQIIYEHYFNYTSAAIVCCACKRKIESIKCSGSSGYFVYEVKISQNLRQRESGSFRSYSRSVRSFRPNFRGESFRPNWGGSFRSNFKGWSFRPDFRGESFRPDLFILEKKERY